MAQRRARRVARGRRVSGAGQSDAAAAAAAVAVAAAGVSSPSTATSSSVGDASFAAWSRGFDDPSATASEEALLPPYLSDMSLIEVAERYGTPLYVYNFDAVAKQVRLRSSIAVRPATALHCSHERSPLTPQSSPLPNLPPRCTAGPRATASVFTCLDATLFALRNEGKQLACAAEISAFYESRR